MPSIAPHTLHTTVSEMAIAKLNQMRCQKGIVSEDCESAAAQASLQSWVALLGVMFVCWRHECNHVLQFDPLFYVLLHDKNFCGWSLC